MTYNILDGGLGRIDPLAEVIRLADADAIILQETTDPELFHKLADRLHMDRFLAENPHNPRGATGLLTRGTIRQAVNHAPLDRRLTRSAFTATVELHGTPWHLLGLHLHAGQSFADETARLAEVPALLDLARQLPPSHILAGDFNSIHPDQPVDISRLREKVRSKIAPQQDQLPRDVIRTLLAAGYVDAHAIGRSPSDLQNTLPTSRPALRTDYILLTPDLVPSLKDCGPFTPEMARFASDHFPVLASW